MYIFVRDFIFFEIIIVNVYCFGVLINMILEEYKVVKRVDDSMVISVKDYKMVDIYGLVCVVLLLLLFLYLRLYVSEM